MDTAVAMVQAYLRVNGYFTVTEFPVVERLQPGGVRSMTDLDILAFRFPGAGRVLARGPAGGELQRFGADPVLAAAPEQADMLIGEVKEGEAVLNRACRDPEVLEVVLARFGCCPAASAAGTVERLIRTGSAQATDSHIIRLVAFGNARDAGMRNGYLVIPMSHVLSFLKTHLREHWDVLGHVQPKDPAFAVLTLLEKTRRGKEAS